MKLNLLQSKLTRTLALTVCGTLLLCSVSRLLVVASGTAAAAALEEQRRAAAAVPLPQGEQQGEARRIFQALDLTDAQREQVRALAGKHRGNLRGLEFRSELEALLTTEQKQKLRQALGEQMTGAQAKSKNELLVARPGAASTKSKDASVSEQESFQMAADYSAANQGLSVLIQKNGKIVFEQYHNGHTADKPSLLASGTKSFSGVMAAAAVEDGLLKFDELVADTITEWKTDPRKNRITVRQLLNLTAGLPPGQAELQGPQIDNKYLYATTMPTHSEPGARFAYGPTHFMVFGELMRRKLVAVKERREDPYQYLQHRVLNPIDLKIGSWARDRAGNLNLPGGAALTAREWAKFGQFVLQGGKWNGKQLVSSKLLAECFVGSRANPMYGLTFWLNSLLPRGIEGIEAVAPSKGTIRSVSDGERGISRGAPADLVMAAGAGNQRLYIIPSLNLVVVRQAKLTVRQGVPQRQSGESFDDAEFLARLLRGTNVSANLTQATAPPAMSHGKAN